MRVFVISLITAGSFLMLSADTRGIDLPSAEWCSTGSLVPVAEFHLHPAAFQGLQLEQGLRDERNDLDFKMVGEFDDDYPSDPPEEVEAVEEINGVGDLDATPFKMVGQFDDDYPSDPPEEVEAQYEIEIANAVSKAHCSQFALSTSGKSHAGQVIAVAEWPQSLIEGNTGSYRLSQGVAGVCLRCQ